MTIGRKTRMVEMLATTVATTTITIGVDLNKLKCHKFGNTLRSQKSSSLSLKKQLELREFYEAANRSTNIHNVSMSAASMV